MFPLAVRIDEYPPLVKFYGEFGIIEASEGGVLPVTLRNIDAAQSGRAATIEGKQVPCSERTEGHHKMAEARARSRRAAHDSTSKRRLSSKPRRTQTRAITTKTTMV